jgi:hypothetical protein
MRGSDVTSTGGWFEPVVGMAIVALLFAVGILLLGLPLAAVVWALVAALEWLASLF